MSTDDPSSDGVRSPADRAGVVSPGGIHSNARRDSSDLFVARAEGAWLWDRHGKPIVDFVAGRGPAFLGHTPAGIHEAVAAASKGGMTFGAQHLLEVEAAEKVLAALGWADMIRFTTSGSEAVQVALRLARAATGRDLVVQFAGHYHGWVDSVFVDSGRHGAPSARSSGQIAPPPQHTRLLPWNDIAALEALLEHDGDDVAAVIMEPIMLNATGAMPRPGYLESVREATSRVGALLVLDETITGFRVDRRGAAGLFGVAPDLAIYGKALASGWPAAAVAGRQDIMQLLAAGGVNHGGTYNGNVAAMAAVAATMDALADPRLYDDVTRLGTELMSGIADIMDSRQANVTVRGVPTAFNVMRRADSATGDAHDPAPDIDPSWGRDFSEALLSVGVWVTSRGNWYLGAAHERSDVEFALDAVEKALAESAR